VVEADETFIGGKAKNRAFRKEPPRKSAVMALVERYGEVGSNCVANVTAKELRPIIVQVASRKSYPMTVELCSYISIGKEFTGHSAVNHGKDEYVRPTRRFRTYQHGRELFQHPQARHLWRLPARLGGPLAALSCRV
jgi:hypothetical protein